MSTNKKNIEQFYSDLRNQFPQLKDLKLWEEYNWSEQGYENSMIMSKIAEEMTAWVSNNQLEEIQQLLDFIELSLFDCDNRVTSFIYTDFLVTIIGIEDKAIRETIKKMMKPETANYYQHLLQLYREIN